MWDKISELLEFAEQRNWTLEHKPYEDRMGFLPCDALGPLVYCVYDTEGVLIGYSQMGYKEALDRAREKHLCLICHKYHPDPPYRVCQICTADFLNNSPVWLQAGFAQHGNIDDFIVVIAREFDQYRDGDT